MWIEAPQMEKNEHKIQRNENWNFYGIEKDELGIIPCSVIASECVNCEGEKWVRMEGGVERLKD